MTGPERHNRIDLLGVDARRAIADELGDLEREVARSATDRFIDQHPEWVERFGERACRRHGEQDASFHIAYLAASIETNSTAMFADYVRWAASMLAGRGMEPAGLRDNLADILGGLAERIPSRRPLFDRYLRLVERTLAEPGVGEREVVGEDGEEGLAATTRRLYLQAVLAGRREAAVGIVDEALARGLGRHVLYTEVVQFAQREIGARWACNEITVADEHRATAVTEHVLAHLRIAAGTAEPTEDAPRCVVSGVEGERHQLGARVVADVLEHAGWAVEFLGSDLPASSILATVRRTKPQLVVLSVTMPYHLRAATELVGEICALEEAPSVAVGGRAFESTGDLWREMGAHSVGSSIDDLLELASAVR